MNGLTINYFANNDHDRVELLLRTIGWSEQYIKGQLISISNLCSNQEGEVLLACLDVNLIGLIQIQHYTWNRLSQIHGLLISHSWRRNGIAKTLVSHCEATAKSRKQRGIYLDTPIDNHGGIDFYTACGFSIAYRMPLFYNDDLDGVTLQKFFSEQV